MPLKKDRAVLMLWMRASDEWPSSVVVREMRLVAFSRFSASSEGATTSGLISMGVV